MLPSTPATVMLLDLSLLLAVSATMAIGGGSCLLISAFRALLLILVVMVSVDGERHAKDGEAEFAGGEVVEVSVWLVAPSEPGGMNEKVQLLIIAYKYRLFDLTIKLYKLSLFDF